MELEFGITRTAYGIAMLMMAAVATFGYSIYILAIWSSKKLQTKHIWLTSLACADLLMMVHLFMDGLSSFHQGRRPKGIFKCQVSAHMGLFSGFVSIASMTWICIDRYYRKFKPDKVGVNYCFYVIIVWAMSFLAASGPALGFGAYESAEENTVKCLIDLENTDMNTIKYFVVVGILFFFYPIFKMIKYNTKFAYNSEEEKAVVIVAPVSFVLGYLPYLVYACLKLTIGLPPLNQASIAFLYLLPKFISVMNPYMYMRSDPELLRAAKRVVNLDFDQKME
ncbi:beta-4C adrenergic receptor-like [Ciona intestinalis]